MKDGSGRLILIHPEVQGYRHQNYEEREFIYFYRLYDRFKLPIATLVIFTDTDPNYEPNCFTYSFLGTEMRYEYPTYKVLNQSPDELANSSNLFDAAILTTYWAIKLKRNELTEEALLELKIDLMRRLLKRDVDKTRIRKLLRFIKAYIRFEKPEINLKFEPSSDQRETTTCDHREIISSPTKTTISSTPKPPTPSVASFTPTTNHHRKILHRQHHIIHHRNLRYQ